MAPPRTPPPPPPTRTPTPQSSGKILGMPRGVAIAVGILALVVIYIVIKRHSTQSAADTSSSADSGQTAASIGGTPAPDSLQYSSDMTNDAALIDALNQQSASLAELEANLSGLTGGGVGGGTSVGQHPITRQVGSGISPPSPIGPITQGSVISPPTHGPVNG